MKKLKQSKVKKKKSRAPKGTFTTESFTVFDGRVTILRTKHTGDYWHFRMYVQEEQRYVRKTLDTTNKELAIKRAEDKFILFKSRILNGEKLFSIKAEELREKFLEYAKRNWLNTEQISKGRFSNISIHTKHYVDFVGKGTSIQNIDKNKFADYLVFRKNEKQDITATTIRNESITIKQMYKYALDEGFIIQKYFPNFGRIIVKRDETRREGYSIQEYRQLTSISKIWFRRVAETASEKEETIFYRRLLNDFIVLQANFGFRTGELLNLSWSDVLIHMADKTASVLIRAENTKVRKQREVRSRRGDVFERIKSYSSATEKNDFVFTKFKSKLQLPKEILYEYFQQLVSEVKAKNSDFDTTKTLYSLRHLFITVRLLAGQNVYDIARFTGTSLSQIEHHYDNVKDHQVSARLLKEIRFDKEGNVVDFEGRET